MSKERNEPTKVPKNTEKVFRGLINAKFSVLFEDGKDKEEFNRFKNFLDKRAVTSGGFFIAYSFIDNQRTHFFYEINRARTNAKGISVSKCFKFFILEGNLTAGLPEEYIKYPIWWVDGKKIGQKK